MTDRPRGDEPVGETVDEILKRYGLKRDLTANYIDAIVRMNQSETADAIGVSRQTINRYKTTFREMTPQERLRVLSRLTQDALFDELKDDDE